MRAGPALTTAALALSELLPFTPLRGNGLAHAAVTILHEAGIIPDETFARASERLPSSPHQGETARVRVIVDFGPGPP